VSREKRGDFSLNTIIGKGSVLNGNVSSGGFTRLDGALQGSIQAAGRVIVSQTGRLNSHSSAGFEGLTMGIALSGTTVTIGGVVAGNVLASERAVILANAVILGDVITRRIQADEGCIIHGMIKVCTSQEAWEAEAQKYKDLEAMAAIRPEQS
jgi:cytoskeletal protein CcmA (bactofilin family)